MKIISETRPVPVTVSRDAGQNIFTVNFNVKEVEGGFEYESAVLTPGVWNRSDIISGIIRARYSADDMEAIVNNCLADLTDRDAKSAHKAMQQWRKNAKQWATELMQYAEENHIAEVELSPDAEPFEPDTTVEGYDGVDVLGASVELAKDQAAELDDETAVTVPELFPLWVDNIGNPLKAGERYSYLGRLWKVLQDHTAQADWSPDVAASLFTEVVVQGEGEPEIGTLDNPIPYNGNMELEEGKYYSQDGVTYLCIRSTGTPVYHPLAQLVGLYVQVAE